MNKFSNTEFCWAVITVAALAAFMQVAVPMMCDVLVASDIATEWSLLLPVLCGVLAPDLWRALSFGPTCATTDAVLGPVSAQAKS